MPNATLRASAIALPIAYLTRGPILWIALASPPAAGQAPAIPAANSPTLTGGAAAFA